MSALIDTIKAVLATKEASAAFDVELLREVVTPDRLAYIEPMHMRHMLEICTGEVHTVDNGIAALSKLCPGGYMVRKQVSRGHSIRVFQGAAMRSPKQVMRFLCQKFKGRGRNDAHRKAYAHLKFCDWSQFHADDKRIWERWALFGDYPARIAWRLQLPVHAVRAAITRHKTEAGIMTGWNGAQK